MIEKAETKSTEVEAHDNTPDDGYHVREHLPDGGGVQVVLGERDRSRDPQDEIPNDRDGFHVQDHHPDNVGDAEDQFLEILEQFVIAEGGSSIDDPDETWVTEDQVLESLEQFLIAE